MHRVHLVIQGRVQGVGFRYYVMRRAQLLGLHGWVRNLSNGDVEIEAEGDHEALEKLHELVKSGPTSAHVSAVHARADEGPPRFTAFETRSDAHP